MLLQRILCFTLLIASGIGFAQTGLQGFDRNYPDTPAGDNPRGFTPQITPVARPVPPPPPAASGNNEAPDPFTAPDPMIDGSKDDDDDVESSTDGS